MAIYSFNLAVIQRSQGQNVAVKAAYNHRGDYTNNITGKHYNFRDKGETCFSNIFAPPNPPEWLRELIDKGSLHFWTHTEQIEKRKDAQLAREIVVALPHELTQQETEALVSNFVVKNITCKGMVADVVIHPPGPSSDKRNYHAHILLTMRAIDPNGFGLKVTEWNQRTTLIEWREQYATITNIHLARHGHKSRIDHRSLKEQGISREPTIQMGPLATHLERKGIRTKRGDINREIRARNLKRALLQSTYINSSMLVDRMYTSPVNTLPPQRNYFQNNFNSIHIGNSEIHTELMTQIQYSTAPQNSTLPSVLKHQNTTTITLPDALPILLRHHNPVIFPDQNGQSEQQRKWAQRLAREKREIAIRHIKHAIHFNRPISHEDLNKLNRQDLYGLIMHVPEHFRSPPKHNNTQRQIGFER